MARLEIESLGPAPNGYVDVRSLGLRTFIDEEYFQYFTASVTGLEQVTVLQATSADAEDLMWRAMGAVAIRAIAAAVNSASATGTLPKDDPSRAVELRLDAFEVRRAMDDQGSLPLSVEAGTIIANQEC